jgi:1-deoxy-D-xylulose-5-phosphate synthase
LAIGHPVVAAMEAAEKLAAEGVSVRVVNARFAKPLDREFLLGVARRTPLLVTLEENTFVGGFGDAVREALEGENIAVRTIALPDAFVEHGAQPKIREKAGLSAEKIAARVMEFRRQRQAVS